MSRPYTITALALAIGCSATHEPCTPAALAAIESRYHAELARACLGAGPDCRARPEIDARENWVRCAP